MRIYSSIASLIYIYIIEYLVKVKEKFLVKYWLITETSLNRKQEES